MMMVQHPGVLDAVIIPWNDNGSHEASICAVVIDKKQQVSPRELLDYGRRKQGGTAPEQVVFVESIPRDNKGMLLKAPLITLIKHSKYAASIHSMSTNQPEPTPLNPAFSLPNSEHINFNVAFIVPSSASLTWVEQWMELLFELKSEVKIDSAPNLFLGYTAQLLSIFLQVASVPVFDSGKVINARVTDARKGAWTGTIATSNIAHIPMATYQLAFQITMDTLIWCTNNPVDIPNKDLIHQRMAKHVATLSLPRGSFGKSTIPILNVAWQLNIPYFHLGLGIYQLGWGINAKKVDRSTCGKDSAIGGKLAQNKVHTARLLHMAGLPAPMHQLAKTQESAVLTAKELGWPLVIKPSDRDRGEGVHVNVTNEEKLRVAFEDAHKCAKSGEIIVERQVEGICHRVFIQDGRLLYCVVRHPISVLGDGIQTIRELINTANAKELQKLPWQRSPLYPQNAETVRHLAQVGGSFNSIPADGKWVSLRAIEKTAWGERDEDVTQSIHSDNIDIAVRAAKLFEMEIVGVDLISPDISVPWHQNGAVICEVNFAPLLGGGEISKGYIPEFMNRLCKGESTIPITIFLGENARQAATEVWNQKIVNGAKCFLTSCDHTFDSKGDEVVLSFSGLYKRCTAVLMNKEVESLVLVMETDEWHYTGFPIHQISALHIESESLKPWTGKKRHTNTYNQLLHRLKEILCVSRL